MGHTEIALSRKGPNGGLEQQSAHPRHGPPMTHRPAPHQPSTRRRSDDVVVRAARTVPMSAEQRQRAVEALAALLLARWNDQPRPAIPTGGATGEQPPSATPAGGATDGQPARNRSPQDAGGGPGRLP